MRQRAPNGSLGAQGAGYLLANVYMSSDIVAIDVATGRVLTHYSLTALVPRGVNTRGGDVLNGIARSPDGAQLLVTGKRWPLVYDVALD